MAEMKKAADIGIGRAGLICNMPADQRLEFIAAGLPILFESARSLAMASEALKQFPREAEILLLLCEEECAKILILVHIIRCPKKRVAQRVGPMIRWFYNHLARLIYAEAQNWKPVNAKELQEWIDRSRQSHYLEDGGGAEFISQNLKLWFRECVLYADVVVEENRDPMWHSPLAGRFSSCYGGFGLLATSFPLVEALEGFGVFTCEGLKIMAEIWGEHEFEGDAEWTLTLDLNHELARRLEAAGLLTEQARKHEHLLINN
jgi:hypothetical protein